MGSEVQERLLNWLYPTPIILSTSDHVLYESMYGDMLKQIIVSKFWMFEFNTDSPKKECFDNLSI